MKLTNYTIYAGSHKGNDVIWIAFKKDESLIKSLKEKYPSVKWSATERKWYLRDTESIRKAFNIPLKITGKSVVARIHPVNQPAFKRYTEQLKLKAYSENTLRSYSIEFAQFLYLLKSHPADSISAERLRSYFLYCIDVLGMKERHLSGRMNAVKFYFEQVLHQPKLFVDIPRPKKPDTLPKSLNKKEITLLFNTINNKKHILILQLVYGMGLRVSEIVNLKIEHVDSTTMQVLIAAGKGKKDRMVNLPQSVLKDLRNYYKEYHPKEYLFEGQYGGQYAKRTVQMIFKTAMKKAGIKKKVGVHGLRHSYATHLLEAGTDISFIQKLLGHKDIKTTLGYARVSQTLINKVISPLDNL